MPDSPDTSGGKPNPQTKSCRFKNIRIHVDGLRVNVSRRNSTAYEKDRDASGKFFYQTPKAD